MTFLSKQKTPEIGGIKHREYNICASHPHHHLVTHKKLPDEGGFADGRAAANNRRLFSAIQECTWMEANVFNKAPYPCTIIACYRTQVRGLIPSPSQKPGKPK